MLEYMPQQIIDIVPDLAYFGFMFAFVMGVLVCLLLFVLLLDIVADRIVNTFKVYALILEYSKERKHYLPWRKATKKGE